MPTATASPSFSGTSFMPSQRAGAAAPPDDSAGAAAAPPPSEVTVLGRVLSVVRRETDVLVHLRFPEKQHEVAEVARCRWPSKSLAYPNNPLTLLPVAKECGREICVPVLVVSNYSDPGVSCFLPYTKSCFQRVGMPIDIDDVLYSNGEWLLLREHRNIFLWEFNAEQKWFLGQMDDLVHQGHFTGKPPHEATIVMAKQDPPKDLENAVTDVWLKIAGNNGWLKSSVQCTYEQRGLNSLTIYHDKVFWLNDAGQLCCAKESANGVQFMVCKSGIGAQRQNLSLVEHCDDLYVVSSGGFLPLQAALVHQITDGGSVPLLNGLSGKNIFTSPKQSGFVLSSLQSDDNKVFTANLLPNVDCAMHSYKSKVTETTRRCSYRHHLACSTVWAVLRTSTDTGV